jgi:hypothetical protein
MSLSILADISSSVDLRLEIVSTFPALLINRGSSGPLAGGGDSIERFQGSDRARRQVAG